MSMMELPCASVASIYRYGKEVAQRLGFNVCCVRLMCGVTTLMVRYGPSPVWYVWLGV